MRICVPGTGTPHDPGRGWASRGVKVPLVVVSVIPQPSRRAQPEREKYCCWTSTGNGAPPELDIFSDDRSCLSVSGWLSRPMNMVGTPGKVVMRL